MLHARRFRGRKWYTRRKIYELCVEDVKPEMFGMFMEQTANFMHMRVKHCDLMGYWTVDIGDNNQVVHLWEYNNLLHREQVKEELDNDKAWQQSYIAITRPMVLRQRSSLLLWGPDVEGINTNMLPLTKLEPQKCVGSTPKGYYRLVEASLPRLRSVRNDYVKNVVHNAVDICAQEGKTVELYGIWFSAFAGRYNNCFSLWKADSPDDLLFGGVPSLSNKWVLDEDPHSLPSHGKLLHPCSFSRFYAAWS
eukprot:TRINITY_DN649_c3_g1_i1.p1 TRINITY_DN649_c3_g1~~TRINITY_DN649_c3_g1_i1.p1  ORF type:complete len:250 (+),score=49.44 TRINITY_DN649_c3_g1_i1:157-906(+)